MKPQTNFRRVELKFLLTEEDCAALQPLLERHMRPDVYGHTTVRNVYCDTDSFRLARRSLEKPLYKEKLRLRSYAAAAPDDPVFVEIKKKYDGIVYKRRLQLPEGQAELCFRNGAPLPVRSQIASEIDYFRSFYRTLHPVVFLSYERDAFYGADDPEFRVTFDREILARTDRLSLREEPDGVPLTEEGTVLAEVKVSGGIPLWLTHFLTERRIFKTSFSKYGTAYRLLCTPAAAKKGEIVYVDFSRAV